MPLTSIIRIYRARLRSRAVLVQELLAVAGLAVGVALLFASQVASSSLNHSVSQLSRQLVGEMQWQLASRGSEGFPRALLPRVRAIPGVRQALPVLEEQARVIGPRGSESVALLGTGPQFARAGGPLLRRFSARQLEHQQALALPAPVAQRIGAESLTPIEVQVGTHVSETLLGATLREGDIGGLVDSPVAIAPVSYAEQLSGAKGQITRIFIQTAPGAQAQVHAALARIARRGAAGAQLSVEPASFEASLFSDAAGPANQAAQLFSAISALVGFMFAFNALLITAALRRDLISELRRHGATRLMTIQTLLFDALILGLLGCAAGLALGELLSVELFHPEPGYLSYAFPVGSERIVTWQSLAISLGAGMLAACVGVLAPLRGTLARPLRESRGRAASTAYAARGRGAPLVLAGISCLTLTTLILAFDPAAAILGSVSLLIALLALLPLTFEALIAGFERAQRPFSSAATRIAAIELRAPATRTRSLAIAAIGAVAVFGAVAIEGARGNMQAGLDRVAAGMNRTAQVWVSASGAANTLATTPFPEGVRSRIAALPGVRTVASYRGGFLNVAGRRVWVIAPPAGSPAPLPESQIVQGNPVSAQARLRRGGFAVISTSLASALDRRIGQSLTLPSPHPLRLRLAALSTNIGWPGGAIVMSAADFAKGFGGDVTALNVDFKRSVTVSAGAAEVARALGRRSGLTVQTAAQREAAWRASSRQGLSRLAVIALLVLLAAVLATAGAMAAMLWQRRPQLAYLKRQGYRRSVLWRSLVYESALLLTAGCLIGAVFGLYGQVLLSHALAAVTGFPVIMSLGPLIALWSVALVSFAAAAIVAAPGYLAARVTPSVNPG